jgi:c(7)-type cytochrome triheme protein
MTTGAKEKEKPTVRLIRLVTSTAVLALVSSVFLLSPGAAQVKVPPDFAFPQGKDSAGVVTFSHEKHKERAEKCTVCHTKVFKMKKGQTGVLTMEKMKAGEQCGACHNGKTEVGGKVAFTVDDKANCEKCHKK